MVDVSLYDRIKSGEIKVQLKDLPERRFWLQVDKGGPVHPAVGQCWIWTGSKGRRLRGFLRYNGRKILAHRYSWILHNEDIPDQLCILHRCDNPGCVNPAHLFLGTQLDNMADRNAKNRQARGDRVGRAKLTESQVREIRSRYRPRSATNGQVAMAKEFGVAPLAIHLIIKGTTWKEVDS